MAWLIRRKRKDKTYIAPLNEQWVEVVAATAEEVAATVLGMVREHAPDLMVIIEMRKKTL